MALCANDFFDDMVDVYKIMEDMLSGESNIVLILSNGNVKIVGLKRNHAIEAAVERELKIFGEAMILGEKYIPIGGPFTGKDYSAIVFDKKQALKSYRDSIE